MRNSPGLPLTSLILAIFFAGYTAYTVNGQPLTELQLGEIAASITLAILGIQGLISIAVEGQELHPGRSPARLTNGLGTAITILAITILIDSAFLAYGIADEWPVRTIGVLAGLGSIALALLLIFFKEGYIGDEATFDEREDGVPW